MRKREKVIGRGEVRQRERGGEGEREGERKRGRSRKSNYERVGYHDMIEC